MVGADFRVEDHQCKGQDSLIEEVGDSHQSSTIEETSSVAQLEAPTPQLVNVVAGCIVNCKLDLLNIGRRAWNVEYNPKKMGSLTMRIKKPKTTALIFSTGRMVVTGATTIAASKLACRKFARIIQNLGNPVVYSGWKVVNMVGVAEMPFAINLRTLATSEWKCSSYEPETFPGLKYKVPEPKMTLGIFMSGKVNFVGMKEVKHMNRAFDYIYPILMQHKRPERS